MTTSSSPSGRRVASTPAPSVVSPQASRPCSTAPASACPDDEATSPPRRIVLADASGTGLSLKWISLTLMVLQMVGMVLMLRVSRTQPTDGPRYLNTTAICLSEVVKLAASFLLHCCCSKEKWCAELQLHFVAAPVELLKTGVPSLLYVVQNNLLFIGISHLSAGTYQVTYQLKILTTAALSVVILGTRLSAEKWFSLLLLTAGVALVDSAEAKDAAGLLDGKSTLIGLSAVFAACFTSGFAGVYLEKILKQSTASIWIRNLQLASFGSVFSLIIALKSDGHLIRKDGFLQGYTGFVWFVVVFQATGGLVVASVMKYADNILKCFGCAIALVLTCSFSIFVLKEFVPNRRFLFGASLVIMATVIYSLGLPKFVPYRETPPLLPKPIIAKKG